MTMEEEYNSYSMSESTINFFSEDVDFELHNTEAIYQWLQSIAKLHEKEISNINYIFCSDEYLLKINTEHLNHNYYTDIITFDLSEDHTVESDIFISIDRVKDNAKELETPFEKELNRVIVHGLLHLIGYNDKTEQEQELMTQQENKSLSLL